MQISDFRSGDHRLTDPFQPPLTDDHERLVPAQPSMSGVVSFMSSNERQGRWELPRRFRALAVMGNVELDLREAQVGYGVSLIEAVAVMGNIEITVPPEIAVECDGDSLLGTFTLKYEARVNSSMASGERTVRVTGTAYAGAVSVVVKGPDQAMLVRIARSLGLRREQT
jgi:hypothetical protein